MLLELTPLASVIVACGLWVAIGVLSGYYAHRLPLARLDHDTWVTRPRGFERQGRFYDRPLRIRRWKDRLPEKGDMFKGGYNKSRLHGTSDADLERFEAETRRAEMVHWINFWSGPTFLLWCTPRLGLAMVLVGCCHLPFVAIQRYNRARIERTLQRRQARSGAVGQSDPAAYRGPELPPDHSAPTAPA